MDTGTNTKRLHCFFSPLSKVAHLTLILALAGLQQIGLSPVFAQAQQNTKNPSVSAITNIDSDFDNPAGISSMHKSLHPVSPGIKLESVPEQAPRIDSGVTTGLQLPSSLMLVAPSGPPALQAADMPSWLRSSQKGQGQVENAILSPGTSDRTPRVQAEISTTRDAKSGGDGQVARRNFDRGALLIAPSENTILDTPFATVGISAHSLALVVATDKAVSVFDLHDSHKNAVVVIAGNQNLALSPGRALVIADSDVQSFEQINPTQWVGYRRLTSKAMNAQTKLFQCEFDLTTMVRGLGEFKQMLASHDSQKRKVAESVLKNAALLMQISSGSGRVVQQQEPYLLKINAPLTASENRDVTSSASANAAAAITGSGVAQAAGRAMASTGARAH
jgi:hypothetical protein